MTLSRFEVSPSLPELGLAGCQEDFSLGAAGGIFVLGDNEGG